MSHEMIKSLVGDIPNTPKSSLLLILFRTVKYLFINFILKFSFWLFPLNFYNIIIKKKKEK